MTQIELKYLPLKNPLTKGEKKYRPQENPLTKPGKTTIIFKIP
jgi:hypothetical protein